MRSVVRAGNAVKQRLKVPAENHPLGIAAHGRNNRFRAGDKLGGFNQPAGGGR